jgi:N6-adenosine-specific RNA methylase IME4
MLITEPAAQDRIVWERSQISQHTPPPLPLGSFSLIVADPPWSYHLRDTDPSHRGRCGYPSMTIEQICELGVKAIAAKDSYLLLWATKDHLEQSFAVARAWGFEYKSLHTWRKTTKDGTRLHFGIGHYGRNASEFVLICTRGNPGSFTKHRLGNIPTVWDAPRGRHSEKPLVFYRLADRLGDALGGAKADLFARQHREGWVCWGQELDKEKIS